MSFRAFRDGQPLLLSDGASVTYERLRSAGLADYYARIVFEQARRGKLTGEQLDEWLEAAKDPKQLVKLKNRMRSLAPARIGGNMNTLGAEDGAKGAKGGKGGKGGARAGTGGGRRGRGRAGAREKRFTLVSRGDHGRAVTLAQAEELAPEPLAPGDAHEGVSPEALKVEAPEKVASRLITTGYWMTLKPG